MTSGIGLTKMVEIFEYNIHPKPSLSTNALYLKLLSDKGTLFIYKIDVLVPE